MKAETCSQPAKLWVDQNQQHLDQRETVNQGNTVVVQEGRVLTITNINRTDEVEFTFTAYNSFGKLEKPTVHVNVTCEYTIIGKNFDQC